MRDRDKYLKLVEWSEEDKCYVGSIPGWIGKCCHGEDEMHVYRELNTILDEWIDIYNKEGMTLPESTNKKYSGKFVLRTGSDLHKALALKAMNEGDSLNTFVIKKLKKLVSA
jgi:predicted HicB family RNase H-like nuclease